jgi:RsiW-degrading membrane proteinase PrsW (M82 family)
LIFSGVLLVGGLNMSSEHPVAAPMPVLHALAAALPGLTFVAMAARGDLLRGAPVRGLTWRQVMLAAAISMTLGVLIATYVEGVGAFGAILLTLAHNGIVADGVAIGDAIENAQAILSEGEQFVVNLVAAAVLAPLVEEFAKGLGVRLMMTRRTTRGQAFLLGAAAGAGFGFLEALLYGLGGIQDGGPGAWWEIMLVRGGSTSLHVFNTALVGLAWWHWSNGGSQRAGWVLFVAAVLLHALWNGLAVTLYSRIFVLETLSERTAELIAIGLIVPLALSLIAGIAVLARRLREPDPPPVAGTPLEVMRPWLGG